jgi:D-glycero-alpha-D-manno-heptose-7-phosphate kinase
MIICRSPLRVSFFGGGTDFEYYINTNDFGATLSCTINHYVYLTSNKSSENYIKLNYSKVEKTKNINSIKHRYFKNILKKYKYKKGTELSSHSSIKSGIGLSSSSSFGSALIMLSNTIFKKKNNKLWLQSYKFERYNLKNLCGMQDQFIIVNGGIRYTEYYKNFRTKSKKIKITKKNLNFFKNNMVLINTKISRNYNKIAKNQKERKNLNLENLEKLKKQAKQGYFLLKKNKFKEFGVLISESWENKKKLSPYIANHKKIKTLEKKLKKLKVWGFKVLGAGGGGAMLVCGPKKIINKIKKNKKINTINFEPTENKTKIVYSE